ncbi:MAG: PEP/pyruvate-binding domain-containing protein [bacterium]
MYIKWDTDNAASNEVGNKAANLYQLKQMGIPVPKGFTIVKRAFLDFVALHQLDKCEIPEKIAKEITEACDALGKTKFAVRSSSSIEDLETKSFAGMYETFLNVEKGDVLENVKKCWQSTFNPRALSYIEKLGIKNDITMAVIVQEMIKYRFGGVMFTINPITGDPSKIVIEYTERVESLVAGETTPNRVIVDKVTKQIDKTSDDLEEKYIFELSNIARDIENHFGCYQDIEWAIDDTGIVILQARPETTCLPVRPV